MPFRAAKILGQAAFFALLCLICTGGHSFAQTQDAWDRTAAELSQMIASGDSEAKREALFRIRNHRSERASRLAIPALRDSDPIVRATAAASVIYLPDADAVPVLAPLLADKQPFVRKEAAYALGAAETELAARPLLDLLRREKDLEVQAAIAVALGQTGSAEVVEPLISILGRSPKEEAEFLRRSAARSIGQVAQIAKTANASVVTPENFLPDKFKSLNGGDISAKFPVFAEAVDVLRRVLQNKNEAEDTRRESAFSLGAIGSASAVSLLQANKNSDDIYLAEICEEALLKIEHVPTEK